MLFCICICWGSVLHSTVCVSSIEAKIIDAFNLSYTEFALLSNVVLTIAAIFGSFFVPFIINLVNKNVYSAVILSNMLIVIGQTLLTIFFWLLPVNNSNSNHASEIRIGLYLCRFVTGFGCGMCYSCLNSLLSIWFAKSQWSSMAAQCMDLAIELGNASARYTYIVFYDINQQFYQPFILSICVGLLGLAGSIFAWWYEKEFIKSFSNGSASGDTDTGVDYNYLSKNVIKLCKNTLCSYNCNNLILWMLLISFGICYGNCYAVFTQTELAFVKKYNITDYQAEIILGTLNICKFATGPICGFIVSKYIPIDSIKHLSFGCIIGSMLFVICGLLYICSDSVNSSNTIGLSNPMPWIFIVCFSFADSIFFGCAYPIIYKLTPIELTSLINSVNAAMFLFQIIFQSYMFALIAQLSDYDHAFWFLASLAVLGTLLMQFVYLISDKVSS